MRREPPPPIPTLAELHRTSTWWWTHCDGCTHCAPMALVPLMIRWGLDVSIDRLRDAARCTRCGHKGGSLRAPSWKNSGLGFETFPAEATKTGRPAFQYHLEY